jgi:hypothetical protein
LLYDDFGVNISQQALYPERDSDPGTVNEGLILSSIVCNLEKQLEYVFELFTSGGDERNSSASSVEVEGTVEVHDPVLRSCVGWRILDLSPFGDEVDQGLRFDHRT